MKKASLIPAGMTLAGEVEGDEDLVVHGRVQGDVRVGGALVVESDGVVRGDVQGRTVDVRGVVAGDAWAEELVRVHEGGRVVGDVTAPRVKVVEGARLRGRVHMGEDAAPVRPEPR
ncbi:MAG: bactofilin family protein, partial [Polyangiales bacterium]